MDTSGTVRVGLDTVVLTVIIDAINDLAEKDALRERYSTPATILQQNLPKAVLALEASTTTTLAAVDNLVQMNFYARVFSVAGGLFSVVVLIALTVVCLRAPTVESWVGLSGVILATICAIAQVVFAFKESRTSGVISAGMQVSTATASPKTLELLSSMTERIFAANAKRALRRERKLEAAKTSKDPTDGESDNSLAEDSSGDSQGGRFYIVVRSVHRHIGSDATNGNE